MFHVLYLLAFGVIGFLVVRNLITNLLVFGRSQSQPPRRRRPVHPELLDEDGNLTDEPLLVIRSTMTLEETRSRLDALYQGDLPDDESGAGAGMERI